MKWKNYVPDRPIDDDYEDTDGKTEEEINEEEFDRWLDAGDQKYDENGK